MKRRCLPDPFGERMQDIQKSQINRYDVVGAVILYNRFHDARQVNGKPVLFLHPKDFCGTLVEIEQA